MTDGYEYCVEVSSPSRNKLHIFISDSEEIAKEKFDIEVNKNYYEVVCLYKRCIYHGTREVIRKHEINIREAL